MPEHQRRLRPFIGRSRKSRDQEGPNRRLVSAAFSFLLDLVLFSPSFPLFPLSSFFYLIREQQLQPRDTRAAIPSSCVSSSSFLASTPAYPRIVFLPFVVSSLV